jgi:hypothetical protein
MDDINAIIPADSKKGFDIRKVDEMTICFPIDKLILFSSLDFLIRLSPELPMEVNSMNSRNYTEAP